MAEPRGGDPFSDRINTLPKYVASRTLGADDLTWSGSELLPADALGAIRALRKREGNGTQRALAAPHSPSSWSSTTSSTSTC